MRREQPGPQPDYQWLKDSIQLTICCGLRRGELARLRWQDVDLDGWRLYVRNYGQHTTKGGNERTVPIAGPARDVLHRCYRKRLHGQTRVIVDGDGQPPKPDRYTRGLKRFVRWAKLRDRERLHFHSLRHSTGAWLASKNVSPRIIQHLLGHGTARTSEIYSHLIPGTAEKEMQRVFGKLVFDKL